MKICDTNDLGKVIKQRRRDLKYTQAYLSKFSGLSVSFISDVENGKKTVEFEKVLCLANILGLDFEINKRGN